MLFHCIEMSADPGSSLRCVRDGRPERFVIKLVSSVSRSRQGAGDVTPAPIAPRGLPPAFWHVVRGKRHGMAGAPDLPGELGWLGEWQGVTPARRPVPSFSPSAPVSIRVPLRTAGRAVNSPRPVASLTGLAHVCHPWRLRLERSAGASCRSVIPDRRSWPPAPAAPNGRSTQGPVTARTAPSVSQLGGMGDKGFRRQ